MSQMEDMNYAPQSKVILAGTPNLKNPPRDKSPGTISSRDGGQRDSLRPTLGPVKDGEEVGEFSGTRQRTHKVSRSHQALGQYAEDWTRVQCQLSPS